MNFKALIWLGAVLAVLGVGVHFIHAYQVKRNAGIFLEQAEQAERKKELGKAIDYLRRYLALAPADTDALAKLGELLLAQDTLAPNNRTIVQAFFTLDRVLHREPDRHATRRQVIVVAMDPRLRRFGDALDHIKVLTDAHSSDAELIGLRGRCHVELKNFKAARADFEEALTLPGCGRDTYLELAYLLRLPAADVMINEKNRDELYVKADAVIEAMLKAHGAHFKTQLGAAAYFARSSGMPSPAETDKRRQRVGHHITEARRLAPDELEVILSYANLLEQKTNLAAARAELQRGLGVHPKDWRMYQAAVRLEMADKKPDAALAILKQGLEKLPGNPDLQWNLADLLIYQGKTAEATLAIDRLAKQDFPKAELDYLRARVHISEKRWPAATGLLERATTAFTGRADHAKDWLSINRLQESTLLLAMCHERLGDADAAGAAYNRVVTRQPQSLPGRFGLARMEWAMGRLDMALREYRYLMQMPQRPTLAWIECAQLLIERNIKSVQPNWVEVEVVLSQAEKLKPVPVEVSLLRAETLAGKKLFAQASGFLTKGYEDKPSRPVEVWVGLANLDQRQGQFDNALQTLDEAERILGDRVELRLARCRLWGRRGGAEASRSLEHLTHQLDKFTPDDQRRLLRAIAESYLVNDKIKQARAIWQRIVDKHKYDIGSRMALFDLALREKDQDAMGVLIQQIKAIEEDRGDAMGVLIQQIRAIEEDRGTVWRFARTLQMIGQYWHDKDPRKLAEADELLTLVMKHRLNWGRVWLARGEIKDLREDYEGAIDDYLKAVALGEHNPTAMRRIVHLLTSKGRYDEAEAMLQRLRGQTTLLGDLDRVAAEIALFRQDPEALNLAIKAVSADSKDYRDHLWLGRIQSAAGKTEEAEAKFRHAIQLAPEAAESWVALVAHLVRTQKDAKEGKDKTTTAINEAEKHLRKDEAIAALAFCHELNGNKDRAKELFQAALDAKPNDMITLKNMAFFHLRHGQVTEARAKLQRIIDLKDLPPAQRAEANRTLMLVIASGGNYQETTQALEKLAFIRTPGNSAPANSKAALADQRARIVVLAGRHNVRDRRKAVESLEDLARRGLIANDERYMLARLYDSVGEWPKAQEQFLFVLADHEKRLDPKKSDKALINQYKDRLAQFCAGLLKEGSLNHAELNVAKLHSLEQKTFRTVALRAQLAHKQNRGDQAVPDLLALVKDNDKLVGPVAMVLEQIGQGKQAEELFRKFVAQSKRPEAPLVLAEFLGRQNRTKEALNLCEEALTHLKVEPVAAAAVNILYAAKEVDDVECQRAARWIQNGIDKGEKPALLMTQLAAIHRLRKDYSQTIGLYRRLLKDGVTDVLVLNNFAWLLALSERNGAEALAIIEKAMELEGPQGEFLDTRAVAYLTLGDAKQAVADLKEAIAEMPTAHRYFHLAQAHHLAGNSRDAAAAFKSGKDRGLAENTVDPLELASYRQLRAELDANPSAKQ